MHVGTHFASTILVALGVVICGEVAAQDYPSKSIRMIVPNAPGSVADILARVIGSEMSKLLGQPVVVENRPGANTVIGYEFVAKQAPADGYTITPVSVSSLAVLPALTKDLRFDPLKDLTPVIGLVEGRWAFGSASSQPWSTFSELVAFAKANPGKLNYGSPTPAGRLLPESLIRDAGLNVVHVPYGSTAAYYQALIVGEVQMGFVTEQQAITTRDRFRVLAVSGRDRHPEFPDAPTFAELGYPQIQGFSFSFNVRTGTPKPIIDRLYSAASRSLQQAEVKSQLTKLRLNIAEQTPEAAEKSLAEEARFLGDIARKVGLKPE